MQCLSKNTSLETRETVKQCVLEYILKIESKAKFRNKGLIYLVSLHEKDIEK
jgi:hypothetical protein